MDQETFTKVLQKLPVSVVAVGRLLVVGGVVDAGIQGDGEPFSVAAGLRYLKRQRR